MRLTSSQTQTPASLAPPPAAQQPKTAALLKLTIGALLFVLTAVLAAASEQPPWKQAYWPSNDAWRDREQHFRFNNDSEPATLDPALMKTVNDGRLALALFEGLVTNDPFDLSIRPGVAERWEIAANGLRYTFHLRADARWSDGTPVTADHFLQSWRRVLDPQLAASYAYMLFPIAGAEDFFNGHTSNPIRLGIQAPDAHTFIVELHQPCAYFLDICAFSTTKPVRIDQIARDGSAWTRPGHLISNGPFRLTAWEPRQYLEMRRNPHYWDHDFVKLDRITAYPYDDQEAAYQLFRAGRLDWVASAPPQRIDQLQHDPDFYAVPYLGTYFYRFNCTRAPFDDKRVRQALGRAIDRAAIVGLLRAGQQPTTAFCPPGVNGYQPVPGLSEDLTAARALLSDAGYPDGAGFPETELWYNNSEAHKKIAEALVEQWRRNLGITLKLRNCEWKTFVARQDALDYDLSRSAWIGDYNDPNTFFDMWASGGGNNRTGWGHARYDALLRASQASQDHAERLRLFRDMEHILVGEEYPIMPIYYYVTTGLLKEHVLGIDFNVRDIHPFQYIWLE